MNEHPMVFAMTEAISLAGNGRWRTAPNPLVGAVLVHNGLIVARGWHKGCGQPHAEIECLNDAISRNINPAECTLVVTLEPCTHHGRTPPCVDALLAAGIRHVVVGLPDPNPEATGGIERLRAAGVAVDVGVCADACRDLIADFLIWQTEKRPFVILKMASTLDGRIATRSGHSRWISNEASRARVHALRAAVGLRGGAVLVGGNTLLADNPLLTARPEGMQSPLRQPLAAAIISRLSGVEGLQLIRTRPTETVLFSTAASAASPVAASLRERGVRVIGVPPLRTGPLLDPHAVLRALYAEGCMYVLCEGGSRLGLSLLNAGLVDEFHLHLAPKVLGDESALPLFCGREPLSMQEALNLRIIRVDLCGSDCHICLRPLLPPLPEQAEAPGAPAKEDA